MIYRSFFKKKVTRIYLWLFIIFSIIFSFLLISKEKIIIKGNEAYHKSFIYFISDKDIDLSKDKNVKNYNKALYANCHSDLTDVFITKDTPIVSNDYEEKVDCIIEGHTIKYAVMDDINIVQNKDLYEVLSKDAKEYYYFVSLDNWFDVEETSKLIKDVYKVEPVIYELSIDSNNYKNYIYIFSVVIRILLILFVLLLLISVISVIVDEKKNNNLYYSLGYSKIKIIEITFNKILLLICFPAILFFLLLIIGNLFIL